MPEVFTDENRHFQSSIMHSGENNGRAKLTKEEVIQMRYDFEHGIKTRKEIQQEHPASAGGGAEGLHAGGYGGRADTGLSGTLHWEHGLFQAAVQGGAGAYL